MYIYDGSKDKIYNSSNRTVTVTACNRSHIIDDWYTIRENGRADWTLYFCEQGMIHFKNYRLCAGQIWICPAFVRQEYHIYKKDNTIYRYLHFTGSDIAELFNSLGITTNKPFKVQKRLNVEIFDKIYEEHYKGTPLSQLKAEYHTIRLISLLASDKQPDIKMLNCVTDDMEHNFSMPYNANKYADMLNISVDRFNHIFKDIMDISPMAYYNKLRMNNACQLLENTTLKISAIAECSGYEDPLYFSQAFKKATGLSPASYRKLHRISTK
ncbi:MAG: AraC family transcriptional regulator [Acutalibacteraceae bacterium]|nr:AraC family transcriptional regulator [Acutalibacteraceae bacterium]MEE1049054.1 AraC family transcriptional regulator [Clostridia bacterium]